MNPAEKSGGAPIPDAAREIARDIARDIARGAKQPAHPKQDERSLTTKGAAESRAAQRRPAQTHGRRREPAATDSSDAHSTRIDFSIPTLRHFSSFTRVTDMLDHFIVSALAENRRLDHILIHGRPGSGTSILARAIARDYAPSRVEEIDAQGMGNPMRLRRALLRANDRGIVIIRHVELLDQASCAMLIAYLQGQNLGRDPDQSASVRPPWETPRDREIAESARSDQDPGRRIGPAAGSHAGAMVPRGTVIATALLPGRLHYPLRTAFEQMIHLRNDPRALRCAVARALRPHGIAIEEHCTARLDRVLGSLIDGAEPLAKAILTRAQIEGVRTIDDTLMCSIIEEDMHSRLPETHYAAALRNHLGGRKVRNASDEEVERIAGETGWGHAATLGAITMMLRENRARKQTEQPPMPF